MNARALLSLAACAAALALPAAAQDWQRLESAPAPAWPRDHGAHPQVRTEWWYATGELVDEQGRAFGFQWTLFRHGLELAPPLDPAAAHASLRPREIFAGHCAVLDVAAGEMRFAQRVRRAAGGLAHADERDLHAWIEDWEIARVTQDAREAADGRAAAPGRELVTLRAADREARIALELTLAPAKPLVTHGAGGLSRKGPQPGNASVYTSWTRMSVDGMVELDGVRRTVRGTAWFDHEWGTSQLGPGVVGWDWLGLRLDDGRELMLYRLRDAQQRTQAESSATLVAADGSALHLARDAFELTTHGTWTSPKSGGAYPARMHVSIPAHGIELDVVPRVADCELDARPSAGVRYWEGPVSVTGSVAGSGYAELTGYAEPLGGRF